LFVHFFLTEQVRIYPMFEPLVLISETILSAYPILIKTVDASTFLQTGIRMAVFALAAAILAGWTGNPILGSSTELWGTGLLNLLHVGASYTAFDMLPAGNAMALFYTYPIWNVLGAVWMFGETIPKDTVPWMIVALVGAVFLSRPTPTQWSMLGVLAALIAAFTETGIYLWFRKNPSKDSQPWTNMATMYGGSGILWILGAVVAGLMGYFTLFQTSVKGMSTMLLFNLLVGFVGYAIRFFAIPNVSTSTFSILSFFGIVSAYVLGWLFVGEVPSMIQGIGAALIIAANAVLINKERV
jgi:drug/metabolite transporter (DMT)-like permease